MNKDLEQAAQEFAKREWSCRHDYQEVAEDAFRFGSTWREQHPSREMIERIIELARSGMRMQASPGFKCYSIDEIMAELEKEK